MHGPDDLDTKEMCQRDQKLNKCHLEDSPLAVRHVFDPVEEDEVDFKKVLQDVEYPHSGLIVLIQAYDVTGKGSDEIIYVGIVKP